MTIQLLVLITVKPGLAYRQVEAFRAIAPMVRAEAGCLQYELHTVSGDPDRFVLLEEWESADALAAHDTSAHMSAAGETNQAFRAGPAEVLELTRQ